MPSFTIFKRGARDLINKPGKRDQAPTDGGRRPPALDSNAQEQEEEEAEEEQEQEQEPKPFGKKQPLKELIRRATVSRRGRPAKLQRRRSAMAATTATASRTRSAVRYLMFHQSGLPRSLPAA